MRVFISCAAKDRELASQLAGELSRAGFTVWDPAEEVAPGDNWAKQIGQALDDSDVMVALVTRGALQSEFFQGEIQYALTSAHFERRLVPVLVNYVTFTAGEEVPWILLKLDPIYVPRPSEGFGEVVERVREIAQRETNAAR